MRFLLDMNLSPGLATWLRSDGHDAIHVLDVGFGSSSDAEIFARAATENRVVVSLDLDFGEIAGLAGESRTGVVLLRLRQTHRAHVQQRLGVAISQASKALRSGAIVIVEDTCIRVRRMPPET
jgi:predicted nuclease of predicted toxin-antitoxin system